MNGHGVSAQFWASPRTPTWWLTVGRLALVLASYCSLIGAAAVSRLWPGLIGLTTAFQVIIPSLLVLGGALFIGAAAFSLWCRQV